MQRRIVSVLIAAVVAAALGGIASPGAEARDHDRDRRDRHAPRVEKRRHRPPVVVREGPRCDPAPRVVVRRDRHYAPPPRVVVRRDAWCPPPRVIHRPWYEGARFVFYDDEPFYFHVGLGLYIGGLALDLDFGGGLPPGCGYYDPYCGEIFFSADSYRWHLDRHGHPAVLRVIRLDPDW